MSLYQLLANFHQLYGHPAYLVINEDESWEIYASREAATPLHQGTSEEDLVARLSTPPAPLTPDQLLAAITGQSAVEAYELIAQTMRRLGYDAAMDYYEGLV